MKPTIYTGKVVEQIKEMLDGGMSRREIAEIIGTTENRLSARLSQLGIKRPNHTGLHTIRVRFPLEYTEKYSLAALNRRVTVSTLVSDLLIRVAQDNLFTAILDDGK